MLRQKLPVIFNAVNAGRCTTTGLRSTLRFPVFQQFRAADERRTAAPAGSRAYSAAAGPQPGPSSQKAAGKSSNRNLAYYLVAGALVMLGGSYLSVPLYRKFCQVTGYGGTTQAVDDDKLAELMKWRRANPEEAKTAREVTVSFNTDVGEGMAWDFKPTQPVVRVKVGEPTLAFFTAKNNLDKAATGVATYNVTPMKAGLYFNKVQCFCFDEQRLRAHEEVEMPVWFFIDPKFLEDRRMRGVEDIVLSYTFWPQEVEEPEPEVAAATAQAQQQSAAALKDEAAPAPVCPLPPVPVKRATAA